MIVARSLEKRVLVARKDLLQERQDLVILVIGQPLARTRDRPRERSVTGKIYAGDCVLARRVALRGCASPRLNLKDLAGNVLDQKYAEHKQARQKKWPENRIAIGCTPALGQSMKQMHNDPSPCAPPGSPHLIIRVASKVVGRVSRPAGGVWTKSRSSLPVIVPTMGVWAYPKCLVGFGRLCSWNTVRSVWNRTGFGDHFQWVA
jgi:hypothetical protein